MNGIIINDIADRLKLDFSIEVGYIDICNADDVKEWVRRKELNR